MKLIIIVFLFVTSIAFAADNEVPRLPGDVEGRPSDPNGVPIEGISKENCSSCWDKFASPYRINQNDKARWIGTLNDENETTPIKDGADKGADGGKKPSGN